MEIKENILIILGSARPSKYRNYEEKEGHI
jgi:hypothetical protein